MFCFLFVVALRLLCAFGLFGLGLSLGGCCGVIYWLFYCCLSCLAIWLDLGVCLFDTWLDCLGTLMQGKVLFVLGWRSLVCIVEVVVTLLVIGLFEFVGFD